MMDASAVEVVLSSLCIVISRPASLFDLYATIAALDEVVNATKEKKDDLSFRDSIKAASSSDNQPRPSADLDRVGRFKGGG